MEENFEGVNESVPAEQTEEPEAETEVTEEVETETSESEPEQTEEKLDRNAIYADARRRAEAEAKRKAEALDAQYADKFKGYTNPITGKPITSAQDYFEAMLAQEQMQTKRTLEEKGIDPNLIEKAVENSPAIKTANAIIQAQKLKEVESYLDSQVKEIAQIDPDIKSAKDIESCDRYPSILKYLNENRLSIVDAYKLVYADKLSERKTSAVKQQAINNAKSQQHLKATEGGNASNDGLVEIPQSQLAMWKEFFPNKTPKELKEAYNRSLH